MNLYDKASIIITPNGYKASKIYALKPTDGSGDLTVTRASTKRRRNASGVLESLANNVPALNYPAGGGCPAWLLEPQRTNLFVNSENLAGGGWSAPINNTIASNALVAPDGATTADIAYETVANDNHFIWFDVTVTSGASYTTSVFAKSVGGRNIRLSGSSGFSGSVTVDLSNGAILAGAGLVESYPDGWYRISITSTSTGTTGRTILYTLNVTNTSYIGDITKGVSVWGVQVEAGPNISSYIPTTGSTVTRITDGLTKTGLSSFIGQTEGTLFLNFSVSADVSSSWMNVSDGSTNNWVFCGADSTQFRFYVRANNVVVFDNAVTALTLNTFNKVAIAYKNGDVAIYLNGVQLATATPAVSFAATLNQLNIGGSPSFSATNRPISFRQSIVFPTRLTNAELAALTTP